MGKVWPLLIALFVSSLALSLDDATSTSRRYQVTQGQHQRDAYVQRDYSTWNIETELAVYTIEQYDFTWKWYVKKSEAIKVTEKIDAQLAQMVSYCGPTSGKIQVHVVSMDIANISLNDAYAADDAVYLSFEHIRIGNYIEALARAYLHNYPPWVAYGVANVITGDFLSESYIADYFTYVGNTDVLRLTGVRFCRAICGEYDVAVAKGIATSLVRYLKMQNIDETLLPILHAVDITDTKQAWLDTIGVTIPYTYDYEAFWDGIAFARNAAYNMVMEKSDLCFTINWNAGRVQPKDGYRAFNADALEQLMITSTMALQQTKGVISQNVSKADQLGILDPISFIVDERLFDQYAQQMTNTNIALLEVVDVVNPGDREVWLTPQGIDPTQTAYVIAHEVAHVFLPEEHLWLREGLASYIAMTLPRSDLPYQNLDGLYEALCEVKQLGESASFEGDDAQMMYDLAAALACYEKNGGSLASKTTFNPILYAHAAAYAIEPKQVSPDDEDFVLGEKEWRGSITHASYTSFVSFLVEKHGLKNVIKVALSYNQLERVFGKSLDALQADWMKSLTKLS